MPAPNFPTISKAGKWDILIQQGSSFSRSLTFSDLDLTGYTFRGMIKNKCNDVRPLATYSCQVVSNNEIKISLTPSQSANLVPGILSHDIEMVYSESGVDIFVARILEGKVKVTPEVTK